MPNWCNNTMELMHSDPEMVKKAYDALKDGKFFSAFHPCPQELIDTVSGGVGDGYKGELHKFQMELNKKYFGYVDWYDWNCANWGTKWEVCEPFCTGHDKDYLTASFDTAWSPPIQFYEKMKELGFAIRAFYYEPGMAFCGLWNDGDSQYYEITGNSEWVESNIPVEIDIEFGISEGMAMWEEQEKEEQA